MIIKLIDLHLSDFKGVHDFAIRPGGDNAIITGANGVGKSTVAIAFLWLLTGKDAAGRDNYEIFPRNEDGSRVTGCMPTVTATVEVDGIPRVIVRQLAEKYSKRSGSATAVYAGDETKCTIDDVPTAITKYNAWVDETICPTELLPLLLNAAYFSEQTKDYRQRRELLLKQFGAVSEAEILASAPQLEPLRQAIGRHSVDEMRQILTTQRKTYNDNLKVIPARIDELRRQTLEEVAVPNELRHKRGKLEVELAKLRREQNNLSAVQIAADARQEKLQLEQDMNLLATQRKTLLMAAGQDEAAAQRAEVAKLDIQLTEAKRLAHNLHYALEDKTDTITMYNAKIDQLRADWVQRNAEQAQVEDTCPCCGQPLPADQVQAAIEAWNLKKSQDLDRITHNAGTIKAQVKQLQIEMTDLQHRAAAADEDVITCGNWLDKAKAAKPVAPKVLPAVEDIDRQMQALQVSVADVDQRVADAEQAAKQAAAKLQDKIAVLQDASDTISQDLARIEMAQLTRSRITELEAEQRSTLAALEKAEMLLALCGEYTAVMVEHLTEQVNQHFKTVAFRLFETQKNGGLREVCEATVDGVPYGSLNTAAKMQANVEIVEAFAQASGHSLPLFLDNRESVTTVDTSPEMQIINLQVAEGQPLTCTKI